VTRAELDSLSLPLEVSERVRKEIERAESEAYEWEESDRIARMVRRFRPRARNYETGRFEPDSD
jgi:hypothetical protein